MAKIPIGGSATNFYTVEARRFTGYDVKLPDEGVIIHNVETTNGIPAVLEPDGVRTDPWNVGETFTDATNDIEVTVNADTGTGFEVTISNGSLPPIFVDVPPGFWAEDYIRAIFNAGITTGCAQNPPRYCPQNSVNRAQMAAFIIRAVEGEPLANYCATGSPFSDVSSNSPMCKYIKRLSELGITTGCAQNPPRYCPQNSVNRAQMAAFLARAFLGMN
jgi:hypothetical protein